MKNVTRSIPIGLLVFACSLALTSCGKSENPASSSGVRVTGTLTVPVSAITRDFEVFIDDDTNHLNGHVKTYCSNCSGNAFAPYAMNDVPSGLYYVYAFVRVNSIDGMPLTRGDIIGFYGGTGTSPPATPTASVPTSGSSTFDITLSVLP